MDMIDELTASVNDVKKWIHIDALSAAHPLNRLCKAVEETVTTLRKSDRGEGYTHGLAIYCELNWPDSPTDYVGKLGRVYFIVDDKGVTTVP